jgi:VWFA-related protein
MLIMRCACLFILAVAASSQQPPQQQPPPQPPAAEEPAAVFRTGVSYVRVDAQVIEGNRVVNGLNGADFQVFDEGVPQKIEYFGRDSEPLWIALLLDVSGSMKDDLQEMANVARISLQVLSPADHVAVLFFSREMRVAHEFSDPESAAPLIGTALREKGLGAGTAINSAVQAASAYVGQRVANQPGRRSIVILTDNEGLNYQLTNEATLQSLFAADTVLNAIVTSNAKAPKEVKGYTNPDFTPSDVFLLAKQSGGEVLKAKRAGDTFRQMLERIRVRYSLHYRAPEGVSGQLRRIRVELSPQARRRHPRAEVRARSGYTAP